VKKNQVRSLEKFVEEVDKVFSSLEQLNNDGDNAINTVKEELEDAYDKMSEEARVKGTEDREALDKLEEAFNALEETKNSLNDVLATLREIIGG
jgi:predicted  nucleic acid-binding Zn-ribbon protein